MIQLAFQYLLSRRRQTILTLLGIFFGSAAFVTISGLMLGFREYMIDQLVNNSGHVHILSRKEFLADHSLDKSFYDTRFEHIFWTVPPSGRKDSAMVENPQSWYRRLGNDPRVVAYSPQLSASVIFSNGKASAPAVLIGCNPLEQQKVTTIGEYVIHGDFDDLAMGGNKIAIGDELAKELGASLYQNVHVSLAKGEATPFKVAAIFKTGIKQMDSTAFGSIGDVQKINLTPNQVNEITVRLYDYTQSASIASSWSGMSIEKVESWDQQNANIFNVFKIQDAIRFLSVGSVLIVAGFGIYNVLNMTVVQKRKDIAILRSMGYNTYEVVSLFFSQGLLLGIVGAFFGLIFGYCLCLYLETIPFAGGPIGAGAGHLIISFNPKIYIQAVILALTSTSIASILPARAAGRLTPLEIIRAGAE